MCKHTRRLCLDLLFFLWFLLLCIMEFITIKPTMWENIFETKSKHLKQIQESDSGQITATSHDLTANGGLLVCTVRDLWVKNDVDLIVPFLSFSFWSRPFWFIPQNRNQLYQAAGLTAWSAIFVCTNRYFDPLAYRLGSFEFGLANFITTGVVYHFVRNWLEHYEFIFPCKAVQVRLPGDVVARAKRAVASSTITTTWLTCTCPRFFRSHVEHAW